MLLQRNSTIARTWISAAMVVGTSHTLSNNIFGSRDGKERNKKGLI